MYIRVANGLEAIVAWTRRLPAAKGFILSPHGWATLLTLAFSAAVFLPALAGLPVWDDDGFISSSAIGGGSLAGCFTQPFNQSYYRPLTSFSYFLDHRVFGSGMFFFHQTNILIHVATVGIVIWAVGAAFQNKWLGVLSGLLLGVMPEQASAVAWVGGRTDILCLFFVALLTLALVKWNTEPRRLAWFVISILGFLFAEMSKEQAAALFVVLPLSAYCFGGEQDRRRRALWLGAGALLDVLIFAVCWRTFIPAESARHLTMSHGATPFLLTTVSYVMLAVTPSRWSMNLYSLSGFENNLLPWVVAGALLSIGFVALGVTLWRRSRIAFWFLALAVFAFLPVSNVIELPSFVVAPYRVVTSGLGVAAMLALGARGLFSRVNGSLAGIAVGIAVAAYLAHCASLTQWGARELLSKNALFTTIVRYDPDFLLGRHNLCNVHAAEQDWSGMRKEAGLGLDYIFGGRSWQTFESVAATVGTNHSILDRVARNQGDRAKTRSVIAYSFIDYGYGSAKLGDHATSVRAYRAASEVDPDSAFPAIALGTAIESEDPVEAAQLFKKALAKEPDSSIAASHLAEQAARSGDLETALRYFRQAAKGAPSFGLFQIRAAETLARLGRYREAGRELEGVERKFFDPDELSAIRKVIEAHSR